MLVSKNRRPIYFLESWFFTQNSHRSPKKARRDKDIPTTISVNYKSHYSWSLLGFPVTFRHIYLWFLIGVAFCRPFCCCYGILRLVYFSCYLKIFYKLQCYIGGGGEMAQCFLKGYRMPISHPNATLCTCWTFWPKGGK